MTFGEKLKKYQRTKFENYKKINNLTINDDEAYIILRIDKKEDIISKFSIRNNELLNKEFIDAIKEKANYISIDYPMVLEILNDSFNSEEKILIRKLIRSHFGLEAINNESELKTIRRKCYLFFLIGVIFFLISIMTYRLDFIFGLTEIFSFIASFSIWECLELMMFEQDDIREEMIRNNHLSKMRIVFNKDR